MRSGCRSWSSSPWRQSSPPASAHSSEPAPAGASAGSPSALEIVDAGHPLLAGLAPPDLAVDLRDDALVAVAQPVEIEDAVEVVVLVLEDAGEPSLGIDLESLAVEVGGPEEGACGTAEAEPLTGKGEAPLGLLIRVGVAGRRRRDPEFGIDRDAAPPRAGLVDPAVGEDAKRHADLGCGQAHAGRGIHRLVEVAHESPQFVGDDLDRRGG